MARPRSAPAERRASYQSDSSHSYQPACEVKLLGKQASCSRGKLTVLQYSRLDGDLATTHAASLQKRETLPGPPVFSTIFTKQGRTPSEECRLRIRKACRSGDIQDMQEAYKSAIRGSKHKDSPPPDSYVVPTREVQPLIRKIMEYHSDEMEMAMEQGSKKDLEKAIAACKKEQLMNVPKMLVKAERKVQRMTD